MLEPIFGSKTIEKILFYVLKNDQTYGSQLSKIFQGSLSSFQKGLDRLETGAILVSFQIGKTVIYQFNPRYPFLAELKLFLEKAYRFLPQEFKDRCYEQKLRKRPCRKGKPL
ncbi:MAG: winged helix-turn-helix transcriptional regulator [Chlamydiia bacterium]|nr:winged helix-turn-helix transcriptional regulator [Chlamydiia bacterium]